MALFGLYGDSEGEDGTGISGQGNGAVISYQYSNSDLYRPGTFAESFVVTESGKIKPKYRNFNIHEFGLSLYGSIQSPLTGARLAAGVKVLSRLIKSPYKIPGEFLEDWSIFRTYGLERSSSHTSSRRKGSACSRSRRREALPGCPRGDRRRPPR